MKYFTDFFNETIINKADTTTASLTLKCKVEKHLPKRRKRLGLHNLIHVFFEKLIDTLT